MTLWKSGRRALQGVALLGGLVLIQGQASCQARSGTPNPPPSSGSGSGGPAPTPPQPPTSPQTTPVTGDERVGWNQEVAAGTRTSSMIYAAYIDGIRVDFPGVSCRAASDTLHECTAPLPRMERGPHTLRLAAIGPSDEPLQGQRSQVLNLVKVDRGTVLPVQAAPASPTDAFAVDVLADDVGAIADIAITPAGAAFAAEIGGRILTTDGSTLVEALQVREVTRRGGLGLFSVALHPDFADNHFVYFAYAAESKSGPVFRLARGREVNGKIGEVAVLIDGEPVAPGSSAVIRFGPDRQLYVALGGESQPARAGAYSGRLLRLTDDGRRATNNADGSPVVDSVQGAPAGLTWAQDVRLLQTRAGDRHELVISQGAKTLSRFPWPASRRPAGLAYTPAHGGWLYIATLDRGLQRVKWPPPRGGMAEGDASLASEYTGVRAVAVAADGTIFIGTANSAADRTRAGSGSGKNYVIRLRPR